MNIEMLHETESLCPHCLKKISAHYEMIDGKVYLSKECPEHGKFRVLFWRDGKLYKKWHAQSVHSNKNENYSKVLKGCPYDCGLCKEHEGGVCTAVLEITNRCNLNCNICFADAKNEFVDLSLDKIRNMYKTAYKFGGRCSIQLSGGEPTIREDLPSIIKMGKEFKFPHIQVNTNGVKLATDSDYAKTLKDAGADLIYLQFDGVKDEIYKNIRGASLLETKLKAIENCKKAGIGVLLVTTVVPGINLNNIGEIVKFAKENMPIVRGIHFQPVSYFGRFPGQVPKDDERCSIADVLHELEKQTNGEIKLQNIVPRKRYDSHCGFSSMFYLSENGTLQAINNENQNAKLDGHTDFAKKTNEFTNAHWRLPEKKVAHSTRPMSKFRVRLGTHTLSITGMGFQDVWNIDIGRLKGCCVQVISQNEKAIPLCAFHLTSITGERLYKDE